MRWIENLRYLTVVVHTTQGESLRGVMTGAYRDSVVLAHVEFLAGDTTTTIDGEAVVPRERIAWIQTLQAKEV
jgi:hypothetical protein